MKSLTNAVKYLSATVQMQELLSDPEQCKGLCRKFKAARQFDLSEQNLKESLALNKAVLGFLTDDDNTLVATTKDRIENVSVPVVVMENLGRIKLLYLVVPGELDGELVADKVVYIFSSTLAKGSDLSMVPLKLLIQISDRVIVTILNIVSPFKDGRKVGDIYMKAAEITASVICDMLVDPGTPRFMFDMPRCA